MSLRRACLTLIAAVLAACTAGQLPSTGFAEPAALERAMKRYYESHATEQYGYCLNPYIDGLTQVQAVDNEPGRLTVDVRYFYRDRLKDDSNGFGRECTGYAGRSFTFGKGVSGPEVVEMTGPRRG